MREIASTRAGKPKSTLEGHVGGGAWVRAIRSVWGDKPHVMGVDLDPGARGLRLPELDEALVGDVLAPTVLDRLKVYKPEMIVGNPPFSEARDQLVTLYRELTYGVIAWILPIDLYSVQTWAATLREFNPRFIRPIEGRVWSNVRGVALWEWWPHHDWHTNVRPFGWT